MLSEDKLYKLRYVLLLTRVINEKRVQSICIAKKDYVVYI